MRARGCGTPIFQYIFPDQVYVRAIHNFQSSSMAAYMANVAPEANFQSPVAPGLEIPVFKFNLKTTLRLLRS